MSGKAKHLRDRSTPPVAAPEVPHSGQLFRFPKPKKPRGRPRKAAPTPSTDDFDIVCAAIRGIPKGKRLAVAKAEARRIVGADRRIGSNPAAVALYSRFLDHINHTEGKDWHSVGFYAGPDQLDRPKRTVERAYKVLVSAGHLVRRRIPAAKGGWDISETTSPTLARAGNIIALSPVNVGTDENDGTPTVKKLVGYRLRKSRVPSRKYTGYRQGNTGGTVTNGGLTSKINLQENLQDKSARASTREGDFQNTILADGASGSVEPANDPLAPRFDTSLPLRDRIAIEGDDRGFLEKLSKGWPLPTLRDQFCDWIAASKGEIPRDAQKAFWCWLISTGSKRPAYIAKEPAQTPEAQIQSHDPKTLARVWASEDKADAPLRAPFSPIQHRLRCMRLARCNAAVLRKLRGSL